MTATTRAAAGRSASPQSETSSQGVSPSKANGSYADGEGRNIRPTRRKLAKTSITGPDTVTPAEEEQARPSLDSISDTGSAADEDTKPSTNSGRGRLRRKRSFDEFGEEKDAETAEDVVAKHLRKRSREVRKTHIDGSDDTPSSEGSEPPVPEETANGVATDMAAKPNPSIPITGPTNGEVPDTITTKELAEEKRGIQETDSHTVSNPSADTTNIKSEATAVNSEQNRAQENGVQSESGASTIAIGSADAAEIHEAEGVAQSQTSEMPISKQPETSSTNGFTNSSAQSPFAALSKSTSAFAQPQPSTSAFAASGFAALASQSQSPFGAIAAKAPQPGQSTSSSSAFGSVAPSGFAALGGVSSGPSPFAAAGARSGSAFGAQSGFGALSNGLGGTSGFGGAFGKPLSSFGTSDLSTFGSSSKSIKPFGAPTDDDEEEGTGSAEEEDAEGGLGNVDPDPKDDRFYRQDLTTGEEDDETIFKSRGKLYMMGDDKAWRERGTGDFKVNSRIESPEEDEDGQGATTARFLMRVDGSHRVVLNSPITKDIKVEDPGRGPPKGKSAVFLGWVDGKLVTLQLKMRDNIQATALYDAVTRVQALL